MRLHLHIRKHFLYYLALISIQLTGFMLFLFFSPVRPLQLSIAILTSFFYGLLGIIHHKMDHTLTAKIMLEYVLIPAIGIGVMLVFLK